MGIEPIIKCYSLSQIQSSYYSVDLILTCVTYAGQVAGSLAAGTLFSPCIVSRPYRASPVP